MKKIIMTILCVCSFLFNAHAQVYDVKFTKEGATEPTYTGVNTSLVTFSYENGAPTVTFTSVQGEGSAATNLEHNVKYNITFGKATSAINNGTGEPSTDSSGTVWAGAKPRKAASQDPEEPEISGPTLVLKTTGGYATYTLSSENTTITLKCDGTNYIVNNDMLSASTVEAIYYIDPQQVATDAAGDLNNDGNITITDLALLIKALKEGKSVSALPAADVNGDGKVDLNDVTALCNKVLEVTK